MDDGEGQTSLLGSALTTVLERMVHSNNMHERKPRESEYLHQLTIHIVEIDIKKRFSLKQTKGDRAGIIKSSDKCAVGMHSSGQRCCSK